MPDFAKLFELIESPLFDTLSIPLDFRSADRASMFAVPYGAPWNDPATGEHRIKDVTDTNMPMSGMLPAPTTFIVKAIRAALFNRRGELVPITSKFYRAAVLELRIAQKHYWQGPLWRCADPITFFSAGPAWPPIWEAFTAEERKDLIRSLRLGLGDGVLIDHQQPFSVDMKLDRVDDWHRIDAPGSLVVLLEGIQSRAAM